MDSQGRALRQTNDWDADIAYGADENRFTLKRLYGDPLSHGMLWQVDGTPYAGVIDTVCPSMSTDGATSVQYKGRTVQGVLADKVIMPTSGQAHRTATGDLNACIADVIELCGLTGYLVASSESSGIQASGYQYRRFINAYDGLRMLCATYGARLEFACSGSGIVVSAVKADTYGDIPSELVPFSAERTYRPTNHMVGLGSGKGTSRQVVHWYADASGAISQTQTLFGVDEVAETYSATSSDSLSQDTRDKLRDAQGEGKFSVSLPAEVDLDVGDVVTASTAQFISADTTAQVTKVTVTVTKGEPTINYTTGTPQWPDEED